MKLVIVTTDVREHIRDYSNPIATFGTAPTSLLQGLARIPEVEVHVVSCARERMRSQEKLADNIWFHHVHVPRLGWMRTAYQGCIRAVRRKVRELRPDVVHGHGTELDCALDAVFCGLPNALTIHGNMRRIAKVMQAKPFSFLWLAAQLERLTLPRAQGIICISQHTKEMVSGMARRCWVVPNAVDTSFFDIDACHGSTNSPHILCVGVISPLKNQNALIKALDGIADARDFRVTFLGYAPSDQPYVKEFHHLIQARPWCTHGGFVDREGLKGLLSNAALLVLPSLEENCPMSVLEAMAAGVPVVASKIGGLPDLIEHDKTGLFCDPLDLSSIAGAVNRVISDPTFAWHLAKQAKAHAKERFHPDVIARRHIEIYREILWSDS